MLSLLLATLKRFAAIAWRAYVPAPGQPHPSRKRRLVMTLFLPLFALVQGLHWLGLLLDELLFPGYRRVQIREPLFVLGVPRSGTTYLHQVLAQDARYTTFHAWECLFALSISARYVWLGLARLDALLGRPGARLIGWLERHAFSGLDAVHPMRLDTPEEDYFALMPALACFILVLPLAHAESIWHLGTFDRDLPEPERRRLLAFYRGCLQRHLYVHGPDKRLLSKNAAFAPLAGSLVAEFPDARFILCLREPERTLPSQLSSIQSGLALFDSLSVAPDLPERLSAQLGFYYRHLEQVFAALPESRCAWVTMQTLNSDLGTTLERVHAQLGLELSDDFRRILRLETERSRRYRSGHDYRPEHFGPNIQHIVAELGALYVRLAARAIQAPEPSLEPDATC
ncbi:sulfotransferase [Thermochromatium tepidum]|uniref:Sulfotransferase n=1 Tax=Thermochromatium tepidum ATCC 43061 TaxID=316276 RepID=A0A6I6DXV6_THETI|nr:sulfotransferase [Thermochromatium tepidum]QGU32394.1 sulfotransferase [Thermochromatium tepidum ATCC 43061]